MPASTLRGIALSHGCRVESRPGADGATLHFLLAGDGTPMLKVIEPYHGFPVRVVAFHGQPGHETEFALCGPGHDPNRPRHAQDDPDLKLTRAEWQELEHQKKHHRPIDNADRLAALCQSILAGNGGAMLKRLDRARARSGAAPAPVDPGAGPPS